VGAPGAAPPRGVSGHGQVYVFRGLDTSSPPWSTSAITNPNPAGTDTDLFGASVAINATGDGSNQWDGTLTLAVGAPGADGGQGAVYVGRTTQEGTWTTPFQFGEPLVPTFADAADDFRTTGFGTSIALTGGVTLAVGSPDDPNFAAQIEGTGAVWIFNSTDGAFVANEPGRIYGSAEGSKFGSSVAFPETSPSDIGAEKLSLTQGEHLLVGAPGVAAGQPACAYRYVNDLVSGNPGGASFTQDGRFVSSNSQEGDRFASAVSTSTFRLGAWCLVGAPGNPKADQEGGGYLYVDAEPAPTWMDIPALITSPPFRWGGLAPDWWKKFTPQIPRYDVEQLRLAPPPPPPLPPPS
jgi:hypothetical protein